MPLNFNSGSGTGSATGYIRYMASTASWSDQGDNLDFKAAIFDLANIQTGWCYIDVGVAPEWVMDDNIETRSARPEGDGWKRGFKVNIYSKAMFGDESPVREWGTNSTGAQLGIQALYAAWEESNPKAGTSPVVEFAGGVPTKIGKGNTNVPTLNILKFIATPSELGGGASPAPAPVAAPAVSNDTIDDEF
tara:strand:- start:548 stop:1120 length:573 start_codon:yes stop_codon:yes gene_type:complete